MLYVYVTLLSIPLSASVAAAFTLKLLLVFPVAVTVTVGGFESLTSTIACWPTFVPSVSLAYTVLGFSNPLIVPPFSIGIHSPAILFTWYSIVYSVFVLTVTLALPPLQLGVSNVIAPSISPSGIASVTLLSKYPVPMFPAISPFTVTLMS